MTAFATRPRESRRGEFELRAGRPGELETLCAIDTDACVLFERAGFDVELPPDHPYTVAERARWQRCLDAGTTVVAMDARGASIGFAALDVLDGAPYLEQLSVRDAHTRRGLGSILLGAAIAAASLDGAAALWLTTYEHLPWNRPFYERHEFERVDEVWCGAAIRREMDLQRRWLPFPEKRIAMRRALR
jgi:GNAT superfamily N-acetyltransferase